MYSCSRILQETMRLIVFYVSQHRGVQSWPRSLGNLTLPFCAWLVGLLVFGCLFRARKKLVHCLMFCCTEVLDVDGDGGEAVHCRWNPFVQRHPPIRLGVKLVNAGNHRDCLCDVHQQNVGHT